MEERFWLEEELKEDINCPCHANRDTRNNVLNPKKTLGVTSLLVTPFF